MKKYILITIGALLLVGVGVGIFLYIQNKEREYFPEDLEEIPDNVKKGLSIVLASNVTEILDVALERPVCPLN